MGFPYMTITLGLYSVCIDRATVQPRRGSDSIMKLEKWNSESIAGENMPHTLIQTHTHTHTHTHMQTHTHKHSNTQIQGKTYKYKRAHYIQTHNPIFVTFHAV